MGSPPQVRGKRRYADYVTQAQGITPAGAGKTKWLIVSAQHSQDHPRRCGENIQLCCMVDTTLGSPPQVRGKLGARQLFLLYQGITPAGAGKTMGGLRPNRKTEDHPRRCGENSDSPVCRRMKDGSPPQVRGKRCRHSKRLTAARITPAGAGKTFNPANPFRVAEDHPRRCGENAETTVLHDF